MTKELYDELYPYGETQSLEDYYYTMYIAKCKRVDVLERKLETANQLVELLLEGRKQ